LTNKNLRLMIIGASWEQVPLIKLAKKMGYYVLATSPNIDAEGFNYSDEKAIVDPRDLRRVVSIAEDFNPIGISADECDYSHYAAVYSSIKLGLCNDGFAGAQYTSNKLWMREQCHKSHILQPRFVACRTFLDADKASGLIGWPVIVKPVDNRGAFGINIANTIDELEYAYFDALMNSHSREVIVEAYIEGTHITVDGCVDQGGVHHNLAIASKAVTPGDKPIIIQVDYPASISQESCDYILATNSQVINALEIKAGLTHSEYILDNRGRCFLVETANRGGGVLTSAYIVPEMSGVDTNKLLIKNSVGERFSFKVKPFKGSVILKFFVFETGLVKHIHGLEEAKTIQGVKHIKLFFNSGDRLTQPQSGAERHGFMILKADSGNKINKLFSKTINAIRIVYDKD